MWPRSRERGNAAIPRKGKSLRGASMWPRSRERGNLRRQRTLPFAAARLQCGRAHVSAETPEAGLEGWALIVQLQCGRAHVSAETRDIRPNNQDAIELQCGRAHVSAETGATPRSVP